jgi:hypothetical protein
MFNLPAGTVPPTNLIFPVILNEGPATIRVYMSGIMQLTFNPPGMAMPGWVALEGITYSL